MSAIRKPTPREAELIAAGVQLERNRIRSLATSLGRMMTVERLTGTNCPTPSEMAAATKVEDVLCSECGRGACAKR